MVPRTLILLSPPSLSPPLLPFSAPFLFVVVVNSFLPVYVDTFKEFIKEITNFKATMGCNDEVLGSPPPFFSSLISFSYSCSSFSFFSCWSSLSYFPYRLRIYSFHKRTQRDCLVPRIFGISLFTYPLRLLA